MHSFGNERKPVRKPVDLVRLRWFLTHVFNEL